MFGYSAVGRLKPKHLVQDYWCDSINHSTYESKLHHLFIKKKLTSAVYFKRQNPFCVDAL